MWFAITCYPSNSLEPLIEILHVSQSIKVPVLLRRYNFPACKCQGDHYIISGVHNIVAFNWDNLNRIDAAAAAATTATKEDIFLDHFGGPQSLPAKFTANDYKELFQHLLSYSNPSTVILSGAGANAPKPPKMPPWIKLMTKKDHAFDASNHDKCCRQITTGHHNKCPFQAHGNEKPAKQTVL